MNRMTKKWILISIIAVLILTFSACGKERSDTASPAGSDQGTSQPVADTTETDTSSDGENVLVVYFSATGTTEDIAKKIATITGADIYEIRAEQEYTDDDLNWHDSSSRTSIEQNDNSVRPAIGSDTISLDGYTTIYIGYPIWWGEEPRIMDTFVESYDFDGITMIPFCTSSSSGIGRSGKNLEENAGSGKWLDGKRFGAGATETEISRWIDSLN